MPPKRDWLSPPRNFQADVQSLGSNVLGLLNAYQQGLRGMFKPGAGGGVGRPAAAAGIRDVQTAAPEFPTEPGPGWMFQARAQQMRREAPPAPQLPPPTGAAPALRGTTPIVRGTRDGVTPDRTQSDLYKQYAQTPEGQFQRYFQSPEMNQYFGALSTTGAPKDVQEMTRFASSEAAPTSMPLATYYRAQSAAGRGNMPEIVGGLTFGMEGEKAKAMEAWAKANPMLAYREYNKRYPAGQQTTGSLFAQPQADESLKGVTSFFPGAEPSGFQPGVGNPVVPTENRSFSGFTQGERMDLGRGVQNLQPFQMAKTTGEGMPPFETTSAPVSERVRQFLGGAQIPTSFKG